MECPWLAQLDRQKPGLAQGERRQYLEPMACRGHPPEPSMPMAVLVGQRFAEVQCEGTELQTLWKSGREHLPALALPGEIVCLPRPCWRLSVLSQCCSPLDGHGQWFPGCRLDHLARCGWPGPMGQRPWTAQHELAIHREEERREGEHPERRGPFQGRREGRRVCGHQRPCRQVRPMFPQPKRPSPPPWLCGSRLRRLGWSFWFDLLPQNFALAHQIHRNP